MEFISHTKTHKKKNHISLIFNEFSTKFEATPENDAWNIYGFFMNLKVIFGRMNIIKERKQTQISNKDFLFLFKNKKMEEVFINENCH